MDDSEAGRFIRACYRYAFYDEEPDFSDSKPLMFAWGVIKGQIRQSVEIGVKNAERGKQGGRPKKSGAKTTAKPPLKHRESDMNMNMNVGAGASLEGSAPAPNDDGGDGDEY